MLNIVIEELQKKKKFKESLRYDDSYMLWLNTFTQERPSFSTDCEENKEEKKETQEMISHLSDLFEAVEEYSTENYLYPVVENLSAHYFIQYQGVGYKIGVSNGQESYFWCERIDSPKESFLDFKHIMSTVKLPRTILIDSKLDAFIHYMEQLGEEDIPLQAISDTANTTICKIKAKKEKNSN